MLFRSQDFSQKFVLRHVGNPAIKMLEIDFVRAGRPDQLKALMCVAQISFWIIATRDDGGRMCVKRIDTAAQSPFCRKVSQRPDHLLVAPVHSVKKSHGDPATGIIRPLRLTVDNPQCLQTPFLPEAGRIRFHPAA